MHSYFQYSPEWSTIKKVHPLAEKYEVNYTFFSQSKDLLFFFFFNLPFFFSPSLTPSCFLCPFIYLKSIIRKLGLPQSWWIIGFSWHTFSNPVSNRFLWKTLLHGEHPQLRLSECSAHVWSTVAYMFLPFTQCMSQMRKAGEIQVRLPILLVPSEQSKESWEQRIPLPLRLATCSPEL